MTTVFTTLAFSLFFLGLFMIIVSDKNSEINDLGHIVNAVGFWCGLIRFGMWLGS